MAITLAKFNAYKQHLQILNSLGYFNIPAEYVCPFCLNTFTSNDLEELSEEHAPQHALGGRKIAITCKKCNNGYGGNIDNDLIRFVDWYEFGQKTPGIKFPYEIEKGLIGSIYYNDQGSLIFNLDRRYCEPEKYAQFIKEYGKGKIIYGKINRPQYKVPSAASGLYKTAYIILFKYTGYNFLFNDHYQPLRDKIENPDKIFPRLYTPTAPVGIKDGVFICFEDNFKGFFVVLTLKGIKEHRFTVLLPSPSYSFQQAEEFAKTIEKNQPIRCRNLPNDCISCVEDITNLHALLK